MNAAGGKPSAAARGTVQLFIARACFLLSGYIISLILARGLGPAEYGLYGVVMSVLLWLEMVGAGGINGAMARVIPESDAQAGAAEATGRILLLVWGMSLFAAGWVAAPALARALDLPDATWLFRIAFLDLPVNGLYLAYQGSLNGHRRFGLLSAGFIAYTVAKLAGTVLLLYIGLSVSGALLVNVLATLGALLFLMQRQPLRGWRFDRALMPRMLRIAAVMGSAVVILQILLSLDLWMLQSLWQGPSEAIGYYVAALNVARLPLAVPTVLSPLLFASLAWALSRGDLGLAKRHLRAAGRFVLVIMVPCCGLAVTHASELMDLLYSQTYAAGGPVLAIQVVAFGCVALFDAYTHALMAVDRRRQVVLLLLALLPLAVLLNLFLIPQMGPEGAAWALLLTLGTGTVAAMILAGREFGMLIQPLTALRVVAATVVVLAVGAQIPVNKFWLLPKLVALLALYAVLLALMRELSSNDLQPFALWRKGAAPPRPPGNGTRHEAVCDPSHS
jgi:O-antigen/teichoic acid export membrane protein